MSKVSITKSKLDNLANAVAAKSGIPVLLSVDEMTDAVLGISVGEENVLEGVRLGGRDLPINNKKVNIPVINGSSSQNDIGVISADFLFGDFTDSILSQVDDQYVMQFNLSSGDNANYPLLVSSSRIGSGSTRTTASKNDKLTYNAKSSLLSTPNIQIGALQQPGLIKIGKLTIGTVTQNSTSTINFPDASGTVALTSDIPTIPTNVSSFTNDAGYLTSYTETDPVYSASAAAGITSTDITNWNGKVNKATTYDGGGETYTGAYINNNNGDAISITVRESEKTPQQTEVNSKSILITPTTFKILGNNYQEYFAIYSNKLYIKYLVTPTADTDAATKKYVDDSIGALSIPTKTSDLTNDSGYLTSYTETDPTVPSWAKAVSKPTYTFSELTTHPTSISGYGITDAYTKTEVDNKVSAVLKYKGVKATIGDLPSTGNTTGDTWHVTATSGEYAWDGTEWQELGTAISIPANTGSSTTGISIANHSTDSIYGVSSSTTSVYGVSTSTTTASKVTVGSSSTDYGVTAAGSGNASLTFTMDTTDTKKLKISFTHTHTAPTLGSKVPTVSASDVTVPIKNADATTVPIKNAGATTVVTSATHSVTDTGHTHTI